MVITAEHMGGTETDKVAKARVEYPLLVGLRHAVRI